uniref:Uncharacterized protein n=1 Tax=Arundo donax TaxID=35708 RepID=A0A0A9GB04_ARUDO
MQKGRYLYLHYPPFHLLSWQSLLIEHGLLGYPFSAWPLLSCSQESGYLK